MLSGLVDRRCGGGGDGLVLRRRCMRHAEEAAGQEPESMSTSGRSPAMSVILSVPTFAKVTSALKISLQKQSLLLQITFFLGKIFSVVNLYVTEYI